MAEGRDFHDSSVISGLYLPETVVMMCADTEGMTIPDGLIVLVIRNEVV